MSRAVRFGWPVATGQPLPVSGGGIPANAILNSTGGYVRNASGGYVTRSYT